MKKEIHHGTGIYIGGKRDRYGQEGLNFGMTGYFTQQPSMWPKSESYGPLWSFCPDGFGFKSFFVFEEDIYFP